MSPKSTEHVQWESRETVQLVAISRLVRATQATYFSFAWYVSFNIPDEAIGRKYLWSFEMKGHYCFFSYLDSTNEEVLFHQIPILRPMKCYHSVGSHKLNNFLVFFKLKENTWICSLYHLTFFLDPNLLKLLEFRINILISYWTRSKSTSFSTSQCISRMVGFLNSAWVCTSSKIYRFMIFVWMNSYMKLRWR